MTAFNLVPAFHLAMNTRRLHTRAWIWVAVSYAGAIALACAAVFAATPDSGERLSERVGEARTRLESARLRAESAARLASAASRQIEINRLIGEHPDWSLLLARLAQDRGNDVMLESCQISTDRPVTPSTPPTKGTAPPPRRTLVRITGVGPGATDASRLARIIQDWRVFDRVTLVETKERRVRGVDAAAFVIECSISAQEVAR